VFEFAQKHQHFAQSVLGEDKPVKSLPIAFSGSFDFFMPPFVIAKEEGEGDSFSLTQKLGPFPPWPVVARLPVASGSRLNSGDCLRADQFLNVGWDKRSAVPPKTGKNAG
jgi:hypothetical protein